MDPEIKIRPATPDDYRELARLYRALMEDQHKYDPYLQLDPRFDAEGLLKIMLLSGRHKFFLAEHDGKPVGFFQVNILLGDQLVQLEPSQLETDFQKLAPLRILRKALRLMLGWIEPKVLVPPTFKSFKAGHMPNAYVAPEYQGQGIYRRFAEAVLEWFKQNQVNLIYASAFHENQQVIAFWQKRGFQVLNSTLRKEI